MTQRIQRSAFTLIAFFLAATALGQGTTGTLKGQIVDLTGAGVAGAAVTVSDQGTGLTRTVTTTTGGHFHLQLAPGSYALKSTASGYTSVTVEQLIVNVGAAAHLTIPVEDAAIEEIVVYGSAAPLMPTATGEASLHITMDELAKVPVSRNVESVALLAPGTVPGIRAFGEDKRLVSFGGSSVAENVYYIDGLNVSNFRTGLGGSSVPFEFYDQFQIKTGGYSAEFGRSTGGVINTVTRRGSNEFEYGVVAFTEPDLWQGTSPDTWRPDGTLYDLNSSNSETGTTIDIYVSGPIIRDRLFFFALFEPQNSSSTWTGRGTADRLHKEKIDNDFWGGNLTWNVTDNHSLSYTAFTDRRDIVEEQFDYDVENRTVGESIGVSTGYRGGDNHIIRYDGQLTDNFALSALYGTNEFSSTDRTSNDIDCPVVVDVSDSSTALQPGCWLYAYPSVSYDEREAYRIDFEYYVGNHALRAGFDREDNFSFYTDTYSGFSFVPNRLGGIYYYYQSWDVGAQLPNGAIVPDVNGDGSRVDTVRSRYEEWGGSFDTVSSAWYLEDTWTLSDAFEISLGIRNEVFENYNGVGDKFFDIDDQWAPRLALSWAPGDHDNQRVSLNWGRYHLPPMTLPNIMLGSGYLDERRYFVYDGNRDSITSAPLSIDQDGMPTTQELGTVYIWADGSVLDARGALDTSLEPMYQDEWIVAYERDFGDAWVAGIRYVNRELQSLIEDVGVETQGCSYVVMSNPGTDMTTFCDADGDGVLEETFIPADELGFPEARRRYQAVELTVEKSAGDNWALQGSYTLSWNKGNTEGSVKSDIGQSMANLTTDFDWPQLMDGADGYLPNDRRHKLRLWTSYEVNDRLTLGANLFAQSGRPRNTFGFGHPDGTPGWGVTYYLLQPDGTFEFAPRGSAGRTDWITQVDLAALYSFSLGDSAEMELRAEVFNVFDADGAEEVYEYAEEISTQLLLPTQYQAPRYFRFGLAMRF